MGSIIACVERPVQALFTNYLFDSCDYDKTNQYNILEENTS